MPNPFVYGTPVEPGDLVDRDDEARRLLELAEGGHPTRLSAPRRYGKTSLLRRLLRDADAAGLATVYVDFYGVVSLREVAVRIEEAYRGSLQGALRRAAVNAIRALRPRGRVGAGPLSVEAALEPEQELARLLQRLLDLPLELHERSGRRVLVVFDEFPELLRAQPRIDGLIRSRIQHHGSAASYVFAGSAVGLMRELFESRERPLFGQARPIHLEPLADADIAEYVEARFERTGRSAGDMLEPLLDLAGGHPQRAMLCAHHLWERTPAGATAGADAWAAARDAVFAELAEALEATWRGLDPKEQAVLAAVAASDEPLLGRRTLERFGLSKSTAQSARDRLLAGGEHLRRDGGALALVDPLFAEWLRRRR